LGRLPGKVRQRQHIKDLPGAPPKQTPPSPPMKPIPAASPRNTLTRPGWWRQWLSSSRSRACAPDAIAMVLQCDGCHQQGDGTHAAENHL